MMHASVSTAHCAVNDIAEKISQAADRNEIHCEDDTCILAYRLLRECEYQVERIMAEDDAKNHDR